MGTYPLVPVIRQMDSGTQGAIKLAVPTLSAYIADLKRARLTVSHSGQIRECHSPQCIEVDPGMVF